jgi:hypothetical protein
MYCGTWSPPSSPLTQLLPSGWFVRLKPLALTSFTNSLSPSYCSLPTVPPVAITIPQQRINNVKCDGNCNGSMSPLVSGGTPPYTISVTGPNGYNISGPFDTTTFNNLCEGQYTITATDSSSPAQSTTTQANLLKILSPQISDTQGNINKNIKLYFMTIN